MLLWLCSSLRSPPPAIKSIYLCLCPLSSQSKYPCSHQDHTFISPSSCQLLSSQGIPRHSPSFSWKTNLSLSAVPSLAVCKKAPDFFALQIRLPWLLRLPLATSPFSAPIHSKTSQKHSCYPFSVPVPFSLQHSTETSSSPMASMLPTSGHLSLVTQKCKSILQSTTRSFC